MQARVRLVRCAGNALRRSCVSSARNAGESAIGSERAQPSAEIARVECAKCRRECDWCGACATLCGDRACRVREMQARVRLGLSARNPLRRSCVSSARNAGESAIGSERAQPSAEIVRVERAKSRRECDAGCPCNPLRRSFVLSARNAGESAICPVRAQPSAEIVRLECAKCRRECVLSGARATLCGDCACRVREMQARVRLVCTRATLCGDRASGAKCRRDCNTTLVRGVSGELEDENW